MPVFRGDPCGIICILITYSAVLYADYVVITYVIVPFMSTSLWGALNVVIFHIVILLLIVAHLQAVFSDPGMVPLPRTGLDFSDIHSAAKSSDGEDTGWTICNKCETYRPPRAHHCRICQRCVRRMDHHCPWINNCVGEFNQKFFMQFLFYVGVISVYSVGLVVSTWITNPQENAMQLPHSRVMHSVGLVVESLLFGLFVIAIGCDQLQAIFTDETAVEQIKKQGPYRQRKSKMSLMSEVFGRGHPILWLLPLPYNQHTTDTQNEYTV